MLEYLEASLMVLIRFINGRVQRPGVNDSDQGPTPDGGSLRRRGP